MTNKFFNDQIALTFRIHPVLILSRLRTKSSIVSFFFNINHACCHFCCDLQRVRISVWMYIMCVYGYFRLPPNCGRLKSEVEKRIQLQGSGWSQRARNSLRGAWQMSMNTRQRTKQSLFLLPRRISRLTSFYPGGIKLIFLGQVERKSRQMFGSHVFIVAVLIFGSCITNRKHVDSERGGVINLGQKKIRPSVVGFPCCIRSIQTIL